LYLFTVQLHALLAHEKVKKSIRFQRDLGKIHTQKSKWKQTAQFIKKE